MKIVDLYNENGYSFYERNTLKKLINLINKSFQAVAHFGGKSEVNFLHFEFLKNIPYPEIALGCINAFCFFKQNNCEIFDVLISIADKRRYLLHILKSMTKINPKLAEKYIISQLETGNPSVTLVCSSFLINFDSSEINKQVMKLLECKHPLIIRQALWLISEKRLASTIPSVVRLLFSKNKDISKDACETLISLKSESFVYLKKKLNYFSDEKKAVILNFLDLLEG